MSVFSEITDRFQSYRGIPYIELFRPEADELLSADVKNVVANGVIYLVAISAIAALIKTFLFIGCVVLGGGLLIYAVTNNDFKNAVSEKFTSICDAVSGFFHDFPLPG